MTKTVESWRIFIAIPLPKEIKDALSVWVEQCKGDLAFTKWVHPEDYHITVQFLGDTSPNRIKDIKENLEEIALGQKAIQLSVGKIGVFGRPANPRILWAGVDGELENLQSLQRRVTEGNRKLGYIPEDRSYSPHISLARKYREDRRLSADQLSGAPLEFGSWLADAIVVYRTRLNHSPMYEEVARISLLPH